MTDTQTETQIQAKGLTAPRVTPERIKELMSRVVYTFEVRPNGSTTTFAHAFLDGEFYLASGTSACVSPENFNEQLGKDIAMKAAALNANDKLWELEGYLLRSKLESQQFKPNKVDASCVFRYCPDESACKAKGSCVNRA
ncbi:MAG: Gp49 family protein [Hylemonella sp.]|nr:Gp49 family protein [Hylemonella sp.]MDP1938072.1 Gp49 family protein [Hylemonella sp.]